MRKLEKVRKVLNAKVTSITAPPVTIGTNHRLKNRCVLRHISNMNFLSAEKKNPNFHKYATFEVSFFMFSCAKKSLNFSKNA